MKYTKLIVLLASTLIMQPVYAKRRNESSLIRKTARVLFYGVETAAGWHFFSAFYNRAPKSLWPRDVANKICYNGRDAGSEALAAFVLLRHGLRGLNRELCISEQFK